MSHKYDIGDILYYDGPVAGPFHLIIEGKDYAFKDTGNNASWPSDVYHVRILEDNGITTVGTHLVDDKPYYHKVA